MTRICVISDTHSQHRSVSIPECDILICCGDITYNGELKVIKDFADWFKEQPASYKVVIFGNHETGISMPGPKRLDAIQMITDSGAYYLENSGIEINGIKFYGSPVTPRFFDWEWNVDRGSEIAKIWKQIPDDTNVLLTHGPPYGILDLVEDNMSNWGRDLHQGCEDLRNRVDQLNALKLHCFGHIHLSYGQAKINDVHFVNAAICKENYKPTNEPMVVDIDFGPKSNNGSS